jgi:hypothetical protein
MPNYYRYIYLDSSRDSFNNVSANEAITSSYSSIFIQNYPLTSSITTHFFPDVTNASASQYSSDDPDKIRLKSLKATFHKYKTISSLYEYSGSYVDYENNSITLVNIPNAFYGQSLSKGSVKLSIFADGVLISKVEDKNRDGVLVKTTGSASLGNDKDAAGIVFYDEGIILLFSSASLADYTENFYNTDTYPSTNADYPRWNTWGISQFAPSGSVVKTSYDIEFDGVNKVPQLTMLAHARKGELNQSNNPTFVKKDQTYTQFATGSNSIVENDKIELANIVKTEYSSPIPSFRKETYISKILIYDKDKNVIGVAKLATPVRKTEERNYTFKLKINL